MREAVAGCKLRVAGLKPETTILNVMYRALWRLSGGAGYV
jgi:hypothetical protein